MEDVAVSDGILAFLQSSIILQTFGIKGKHHCQDVEHIQIPPYVAPKPIGALWDSTSPKSKRDIWVFFRGKMEIHPKNISGHVYNNSLACGHMFGMSCIRKWLQLHENNNGKCPQCKTRLSWLTSEFFISQTWLSMGYIIDRSDIFVIPTVFHNQKSTEKALKRLLCPQFM